MSRRINPRKKTDSRAAGQPEHRKKGLQKGWRLSSARAAVLARRRQRARRERLRQEEERRRQQRLKTPRWILPDQLRGPARRPVPAGMDYGSRIPENPEDPIRKPRRRRFRPVRQPVMVKPGRPGRVHGPNRRGESARSWGDRGNSTRVPVDEFEFMDEEF